MVVSKKILCYICNKKCSGNVLRYQDRYYHKQCFENDRANNQNFNEDQSSLLDNGINQIDNSSRLQSQRASPNPSNRITESPNRHMTNSGLNGHSNHAKNPVSRNQNQSNMPNQRSKHKGQTIDYRRGNITSTNTDMTSSGRSATLPHSASSPANGFLSQTISKVTSCAGCGEQIRDGQALIALDLHWHVWCFKCSHCQNPLHGEYVAKDGKAYCEKDYQKLYGVVCVYCKRYITGKVLQAGEAHHFHPSCARCSKCGDPFVPGEEMYLQGEVTWHPRCGPGPDHPGPIEELELDGSNRSQVSSKQFVLFFIDCLIQHDPL